MLAPLGISKTWDDGQLVEFGALSLSADGPVTENIHIAFEANSCSEVESVHAVGVRAGFQENGEPGYRERYAPDYFAAYLRDPDSNNVEAVYRDADRRQRR